MQRVVIVANGCVTAKDLAEIRKTDFLVGVDFGAIILHDNNFKIDLAVGDFDSVSRHEYFLIKKHAKEVIKYNSDKDQTDSELAVKTIIKRGYKKILILGAIGSRIDHTLANIALLERYQKKQIAINLIDNNNFLSLIKDKIKVAADLKYKYYSLLSLTSFSVVSLIGFKFPLDKKKIFRGETLCVSNELRESAGEIKVFKGKIILIRSTD